LASARPSQTVHLNFNLPLLNQEALYPVEAASFGGSDGPAPASVLSMAVAISDKSL